MKDMKEIGQWRRAVWRREESFPLFQQLLLQQLWLTHPLYSRLTRLEAPSPPLAVCWIVLTSARCWIRLLLMGVGMLMSTGLSRAGQVKQVKHLPPLLISCVWVWQQIQMPDNRYNTHISDWANNNQYWTGSKGPGSCWGGRLLLPWCSYSSSGAG